MKTSKYSKTIFILGLAGVLFSGYLSAVKLFTSTCAFDEPCPYFLGYPACWFGFGMFLIIFLFGLLNLLKVVSGKSMTRIVVTVSALGILFAGYFVIPEVKDLMAGISKGYTLSLPTCVYGLVFYIIIFFISSWHLKSSVRILTNSLESL